MARVKSNSELVKEFFAAERAKGMSYFFQDVVDNYTTRSIVFRSQNRQDRLPVTGTWLKERIRQWLIASGEIRTDKQLINLTRAVIANVPAASAAAAVV